VSSNEQFPAWYIKQQPGLLFNYVQHNYKEAAVETSEQMIRFPANGGDTPGYLASPADAGRYPAVVVIQEWWGLVPNIKDVTRRLAQQGFVALAPDLYHGQAAEEPDEARKLAMELDRARAVREIQGAVDYLRTLDQVSPKQVGVVGWCMGGSLAISMAAEGEHIGCVVVFYGAARDEQTARQVKAPVLGLFGEADTGIPPERVRQFETILQEQGVAFDFHIYPGAPHAFFNDARPHIYQPEAAADAWGKTLAWFRRYLGEAN
jgi:carboxymethylenebutenolidase